MIIDIPLYIFVISIIAALSLIGVIVLGYFFIRLTQTFKDLMGYLLKHGMDQDDLEEMIDRRFVLMVDSEELFKKHVEEKVMGKKSGTANNVKSTGEENEHKSDSEHNKEEN